MLEHRARIRRLKQTQELLKKRLIAKTEEELLVQDKEIEERIAGPGFATIMKGPTFLWSNFLLGRVVRRFCVDRYALSPTSRPSIL